MAESPSESTSALLSTTTSTKPAQSGTVSISSPQSHHVVFPEIPIEIINEEEIVILDAALAASHSILPSVIRSVSPSQMIAGGSPITIRSITLFSKRKLSACLYIEESYLHRFRRNQSLGVTDLTGTVRLFYITVIS
ncbi:hypothetical protein [Arabidopsis thaliana]|uniref:Exonuclease V n=1 Tax=Arabidopsis thaliana TaxID=3702 RepID=Q9M1I9_ARATH|nr:exonuclease V [Arabidopsis thaliana]AAX55178.1 hypothetical protein At3g57110 [Arabidopsis thaliana]AEE79615.1 exonuclease V [Arabidopsis thaliana]CAB72181.1 hypothetical protein [Arabidopsis thaliana]|eukprot:NP_191270.1 exonuclease V [Arabidopsis thaliana]